MNQRMNSMRRNGARLAVWLMLSLLLFVAADAAAVTISGKVRDSETGESVPGAAIQVAGTTRGAAASVEGLFSIVELPSGETELVITALGYKTQRHSLVLNGGDQHLVIQLVPEAVALGEIDIVTEARRPEDREYTPKVAQYTLQTRQLTALPQVIESDLFRSLQILPGVLPTSDFSADLNIWGGSSDQNLILLNGIDVYKPTHLGGLFSVFNTDAIKDVKLIKGGFGSRYGGRLSAVVDIADREGNRNDLNGKLGVSFLSSQATLEGPLPRGSWLVAGRRTYLDWATKVLKNNGAIDYDFPYYFYDFNVKLTRDFAQGDRISPSAYFGRDRLDIVSTTNDRIRLDWGNTTYSLPFVKVWSHRLFSTTTVAGSFFDSDFRFETGDTWFGFKSGVRDLTFKSDLSWFLNAHHTFDAGVSAKVMRITLDIGGPNYKWADRTFDGVHYAAYVSDDYRPTGNLTLTPGLRFEYDEIADATDVLPRMAAKYQLTDVSSASASFGLYSQYLQLVSVGQNFASLFDSYVPTDVTLNPNRGEQYALSYETQLGDGIKLSSDIYYKRFHQVLEFKKGITDTPDPTHRPLSELFNQGEGEAYGFDLFLQGTMNRYTFMLGYALGTSTREFADVAEYRGAFPAHFDRVHNGNVFLSRTVGKHQSVEVRFNYGTGQPITDAVAMYDAGLGLPVPGHMLSPSGKNARRLPDYHRLDVAYRLNYQYRHWKLSPYLEIINVYGRENPLSISYSGEENPVSREYTNQLPFLPSIGITAEF